MVKDRLTTEAYINLSLSGATVFAISPFIFYRITIGDWIVASLNGFCVACAAALFIHVWRTGETRISGILLSSLCLLVLIATISLRGATQLLWTYPALIAVFFLMTPHVAALLCSATLFVVVTQVTGELETFMAIEFYISSTVTLLFGYAFAKRMRDQQESLKNQANTDALTGAGNRHAMEAKLLDLLAFHRRNTDSSASLILLDLDRFKRINDTFGHGVGDQVLKDLVKILKSSVRSTDSVYRFGGEEFVLLLENTPIEDAEHLAEHLRQTIEQNENMLRYQVTISVGTAQYAREETAFEWLGRADRAMYQAKDAGRNTCRSG